MRREWSTLTAQEKAALSRGRHRIRLLGDRYVCSKRFCPFTGTYQEGVLHMREAKGE